MSSPDRDISARRAAHNEVARRAINESVDPAPEAGWDLGLVERSCECGNADCRARLSLTVEEYEAVRRDARRFAVLHDHVIPAAERVVEQRERYTVVEKLAEAAAIAVTHDPRD